MYRAAILGCGPRAVAHAEAYAHVASGKLLAACDLNRARLDAFCDHFGVPARFTDLDGMLEATATDLLHVVTTPERTSFIETIIRHRPRAILMEKPLACRPSAGYLIMSRCDSAGIPLYSTTSSAITSPSNEDQEAIQAQEIGELVSLRATSKGRLFEQGTHMLDLLSYFLDDEPARSILAQAEGGWAFGQTHSSPDNMLIALRWRDDVPVTVESGAASPTWRGEPNFWWNKGVEAVGTRGFIAASTNHGWWMVTEQGAWSEGCEYDPEDLLAQARLTEGIFQTFADSSYIHLNRPAVSPIAFELAQNALKSALERRRISLPAEPVPDRVWDELQTELNRSTA